MGLQVILGNLNGSPFIHLRACRHLVLELRRRCHSIKTASERKLYGFVMELYSYIVLCNSITLFGMNCNRTLVHDPFLQSLDELQDFGAFGVMFGGGHHLFEMISLISLFATRKASDTDLERYGTYEHLKNHIVNWNPPAEYSSEHDYNQDFIPGRKAALELCRQALLIFLENALSPFSKYNSARIHHLQPILSVAMYYLPQVLPTKFSCIVMWPLMVMGSFLVEEEHRKALKDILIQNQYIMRNTLRRAICWSCSGQIQANIQSGRTDWEC